MPNVRKEDKVKLQAWITTAGMDRVDKVADGLGLDRSGVVRLLLREALPGLEERARRAQEKGTR